MRKFKESLDYLQLLLENKDHLIDRLSLTDAQKEELKSFFKAHPNYESKIDWNNKNLAYEDFRPVLDLEGKSRNSIKKYGLSGKAQIADLVEGKDYEIVKQEPTYTLYYVKTFKGSEVLARPTTPPEGVTGKWCIAGRNYSPGTNDSHWARYTKEGYGFFFVFTPKSKYALSCQTDRLDHVFTDPSRVFQCFSKDDNQISPTKWSKTIQQAIHELTHSEFFNRFTAEVEERQYQIQQQRQKNTEALEQEIAKTMKDLKKGIVDPKYIGSYQSTNFAWQAEVPAEIKNQPTLNLWEVWFKDGGVSHDFNDVDFAEVFRFMRQLEIPSIKIPDNIAIIGNSCFANFLELQTVTIPSSVKFISSKAFVDAGIRTIQIPKTVKYIAPGIFQGCQYLESVKFEGPILGIDPDTYRLRLPEYLFSGNYSLTDVELPQNWTIVPGWTFERCFCLRHIHLSDSIIEFGNGAFFKCEALREIPWTANLQKIGAQAFGSCKALREIIVPETVQSIDYKAFADCICDRVVLPHSLKELSKFSLWGLDAKEIIFKGTKIEWADLISKSHLKQYGLVAGNSMPGVWYAHHILPVLKFQPEN